MHTHSKKAVCRALAGLGASAEASVDTRQIVLQPLFAAACQQNRCGSYARNWSCPPAEDAANLGPVIQNAGPGYIFQTQRALEDSFDIEGMEAARREFSALCERIRERFASDGAIVFGTGPCTVCAQCAYPEPCRFPSKKTLSLEAASVDVSTLCELAGLPYAHAGLVVYTGLLLFPVASGT